MLWFCRPAVLYLIFIPLALLGALLPFYITKDDSGPTVEEMLSSMWAVTFGRHRARKAQPTAKAAAAPAAAPSGAHLALLVVGLVVSQACCADKVQRATKAPASHNVAIARALPQPSLANARAV
jgi:hypothetical protein